MAYTNENETKGLPPGGDDDGGQNRHTTVKRCWLRVVGEPSRYEIKSHRTVIGKDPSADCQLTDEYVSRRHCEIRLGDDEVQIADLGSRNGTFVNNIRVDSAYLTDGVELKLGNTRILFGRDSELATRLPLSQHESFGALVGSSTAMRRAFFALERACNTDDTVLIEGETGTGKEVAARELHSRSRRAQKPFIVIDCGAIAPNLIESHLFGHERGTFTGAEERRIGQFEAAHGGTVFLDEIGELPLHLQPRLLRVLESRTIKRLGATHYRDIDVRVIAATNRNLNAAINEGTFRGDLFYRLAVIRVRMPPLREHLGDIHRLVERFRSNVEAEEGPSLEHLLKPELLARMQRYSWPGNVRELQYYLRRNVLMEGHAPLSDDERQGQEPFYRPDLPLEQARRHWNHQLEGRYVLECLERAQGNVSAAARAAGVDRSYFHSLLRRHGLR